MFLFNKKKKGILSLPDDGSREHYYKIYGAIRLILNAIGLNISIIGYYLLVEKTLIWLAGISAIILIICKPNGKRIDADLSYNETENQDTSTEDN